MDRIHSLLFVFFISHAKIEPIINRVLISFFFHISRAFSVRERGFFLFQTSAGVMIDPLHLHIFRGFVSSFFFNLHDRDRVNLDVYTFAEKAS